MTPIQACEETRDLWTEMARVSVEEERIVRKWEVPGPWQDYSSHHYCPCCEYAGRRDCSFCPMYTEWIFYSSPGSGCPCEEINSPYEQWRPCSHIPEKTLCIDVEFFCLLIAEMAEEAIERRRSEE